MSIERDIAADHIRLQSIDPTNLIDAVRNSCLVDKMKIYEALEAQALLAQKESGVQFSKKRKVLTPRFTVSGAGTDAVNGFYEEDGEHQGRRAAPAKAVQRAAVQGGRLVVRMWRGAHHR